MAAVKTWDLQLFWHLRSEQRTIRSLDVTDDGILRETLEQLVQERMGPRWRGDLAEWSMRVTDPRNGREWATVSVDPAGRAVIRR